MKDYTNKIEKYLRGQMSHEEEARFEETVKSNALVRFQAGFMAMLIRKIKMLKVLSCVHFPNQVKAPRKDNFQPVT